MSPHEVFQDSGRSLYRAELSAGGVRFIAQALEALNPNDEFTKEWRKFETRCKNSYWQDTT